MRSLVSLIEIVLRTSTTEEAVDAVLGSFGGVSSGKSARSYLHVAATLGLLHLDGPFCEVTPDGNAFLRDREPGRIRGLLIERVAGVEELLELLKTRPQRLGVLHAEMRRLGFTWVRNTQVRYRLRWLEEVGLVRREGKGRPVYRLADDEV